MSAHVKIPPGDNVPAEIPGAPGAARDAFALWAGILTGPILWFVHQQVCFVLVPWVCTHGGVTWLHAATLVCLAGTAMAGFVARGYGRREAAKQPRRAGAGVHTEITGELRRPDEPTAGEQRALFMARLGVLSSVFFALVIIAQGLPNFLLDPCQR